MRVAEVGEAFLAAGANLNANASNVTLTAVNTVAVNAIATSKSEDGSKTGIGLSFALNIAPITTRAELEDTFVLTGGRDLTLAATTTPTIITRAAAGAGGDSFSLGGAVALAIGDTRTTARIGTLTGSTSLTGAISVKAYEEDGANVTSADGAAAGNNVGIGLAIAVNITTDRARATTERILTTTGTAASTIETKVVSRTEVTTLASVKGESKDQPADKDSSQEQSDKNSNFAKTKAPAGTDTQNGQGSDQSTSDGPVGVAAAISVNVSTVTSEAAVLEDLTTAGTLTLRSLANGDAVLKADGSATVLPTKTMTFDPTASGVVDLAGNTITVGNHGW
ncbi:MAG TPA: hypothetical protein PLV92_26705, partial [Pirellulaceae bacterium]|nr:hypothetical protein [Pirellulaceae bacterium]